MTFQVMTFTGMSATQEDTVCAQLKSLQYLLRIDRTRAHHPNHPKIGGILNPTYSSEIGPCIGAPVAAKSHDFRFEIFHSYISSREAFSIAEI